MEYEDYLEIEFFKPKKLYQMIKKEAHNSYVLDFNIEWAEQKRLPDSNERQYQEIAYKDVIFVIENLRVPVIVGDHIVKCIHKGKLGYVFHPHRKYFKEIK